MEAPPPGPESHFLLCTAIASSEVARGGEEGDGNQKFVFQSSRPSAARTINCTGRDYGYNYSSTNQSPKQCIVSPKSRNCRFTKIALRSPLPLSEIQLCLCRSPHFIFIELPVSLANRMIFTQARHSDETEPRWMFYFIAVNRLKGLFILVLSIYVYRDLYLFISLFH